MKLTNMMFFKKAGLILVVLITGFAFGNSMTVIYAKHHHPIPGVDYPYDSVNYYNPTTVDWADSRPSTFALRDLASNGGSVFDLTRYVKSVLYGDKFNEWKGQLEQALGITISNRKPLSIAEQAAVLEDYANAAAKMSAAKTAGTAGIPSFYNGNLADGSGYDGYDHSKQFKYLNDRYLNSNIAVQNNADTGEMVYSQLKDALNRNYNVESIAQVTESDAEIKSLQVLAANLVTNSLAEGSKINNATHLQENAERSEVKYNEAYKTIKTFLDPYNEQDRKMLENIEQNSDFKMYHSQGMPDFR